MSQNKIQYNHAVVIGRFTIPHNGHFHLIREAMKVAQNVIIVLGSSNNPCTPHNPFSAEARQMMILRGFSNAETLRIWFAYVEDEIYSDSVWAAKVQFSVEGALEEILDEEGGDEDLKETCLVGFSKDESSFYLKMFPQWDRVEVTPYTIDGNIISATPLRDSLFTKPFPEFEKEVKDLIPPKVLDALKNTLILQPQFLQVCEEHKFLTAYKEQFKNYAYPPVFVTTDAVVIQSGHVLMVQRRSEPGKGLWALPGGFLNQNETLKECVLRELVEETRIKVPGKILEKSIKSYREFDHPKRSLRGRTITMAYHFQLEDVGELPKVKGSDDAVKAQWFPVSEVLRSRTKIFEDHLDIIRYFLGYL